MQSTSVSLASVAIESVEDYAHGRTLSIGVFLQLVYQLLRLKRSRGRNVGFEVLPVLADARRTTPDICLRAHAASMLSSIVYWYDQELELREEINPEPGKSVRQPACLGHRQEHISCGATTK